MEFIDTHTHIYLKEFSEDIDTVMVAADKEGIKKIFLPAIDSSHIQEMLSLEKKYQGKCFMMMGLHPCSVKENVADELINVKCSPTIVNEKVKKQESFFGFDIEIEMSKCPVLNDIKIIEKNSERNSTTPVLKESNTTNVEKFYDFDNYIHNVKDIITKF